MSQPPSNPPERPPSLTNSHNQSVYTMAMQPRQSLLPPSDTFLNQSSSSSTSASNQNIIKPVSFFPKQPQWTLPQPLPWSPRSAAPLEVPPDFSDMMNSCLLKSTIGTFGGGVMGLAMGVFLGAMSDMTPPVTVFNGKEIPQAPLREQARVVMRATGEKSIYWCKNFAFLTGVFTGSECIIEKYRGEKDVWNATLSGCVTGAAIQAKSGPQAAVMGCVGFATFSVVIDKIMGD